jgi:hypothetical protein
VRGVLALGELGAGAQVDDFHPRWT